MLGERAGSVDAEEAWTRTVASRPAQTPTHKHTHVSHHKTALAALHQERQQGRQLKASLATLAWREQGREVWERAAESSASEAAQERYERRRSSSRHVSSLGLLCRDHSAPRSWCGCAEVRRGQELTIALCFTRSECGAGMYPLPHVALAMLQNASHAISHAISHAFSHAFSHAVLPPFPPPLIRPPQLPPLSNCPPLPNCPHTCAQAARLRGDRVSSTVERDLPSKHQKTRER